MKKNESSRMFFESVNDEPDPALLEAQRAAAKAAMQVEANDAEPAPAEEEGGNK